MSYVARNHPQQTATRGALDEVDDRATPWDFFHPIADRFGGFTIDAAAAPHNAKCERYFTRAEDGLSQPWAGERVWCNPPYSDIAPWARKANQEHTALVVMLLPANRAEQRWWQQEIEPYRDREGGRLRVEFLPGRLRFIKAGQTEVKPNERPPFGCCLAIWTPTPRVYPLGA